MRPVFFIKFDFVALCLNDFASLFAIATLNKKGITTHAQCSGNGEKYVHQANDYTICFGNDDMANVRMAGLRASDRTTPNDRRSCHRSAVSWHDHQSWLSRH